MAVRTFGCDKWAYFDNETYEEFEDTVYQSRKKSNKDFSDFLTANLKELEFKKKKNKQIWEYVFEEDKDKKIKVIEDDEGVHVFAMNKNKENEDIEREIVQRDKGETFVKLMDRIMDGLEVIECSIFDIPTNLKTDIIETPKQSKNNKNIKRKNKEEDENMDEYDPSDDDEDDEDDDDDDDEEEEEEIKTRKRRSVRIKKNKTKTKKNRIDDEYEGGKKKINRKRRRADLDDIDDDDESPKNKKRRIMNGTKKMKKEFVGFWMNDEYVKAIHLLEDKYCMTSNEINDLIKDVIPRMIYDDYSNL